MDSIFQIKINQNKLQKILNQLSRQQDELSSLTKNISDEIKNIEASQTKNKKYFQEQIQSVLAKLVSNYNSLSQHHNQGIRQVKINIAQTAQTIFLKNSQLQETIQANSKQILKTGNQLNQKIIKINDTMTQMKKKQSQNQILNEKVEKLEKTLNKTVEVTDLLQNKNFLYFLQMLVDKQAAQGTIKGTQLIKQLKNPFIYQTTEQKSKRYKDLKRTLNQTHRKIEVMQTQYTQFFHTTNEQTKQNRQETHLHYAFLSSKIKQLQNKLQQQQITNIQSLCVQKILYPSQFKEKSDKNRNAKNKKDQQNTQTSLENQFKYKDQILALIKQKIDPIRDHNSIFSKQILQKFQDLQDEVWKNNKKLLSLQGTLSTLKTQFQKLNQKWKINNHYSQFSNQKDHMSLKTIGQFLNQFRNIQDELQDKLHEKVDASIYKKTNQQNAQKIKIIHQQIQLKANKEQTRKAFNFIQQKIKQIITIIADMQNSTKKTAASKMIVQCLSCDQNFFQQSQNQNQINQASTCRVISPRLSSTFNLKKDKTKLRHQYRKSNIQG